jgi:hypothetical protein
VFVLALIFLLLAILLLFAGLFGGGGAAHLDLGSFSLDTNAAVVFFLGMATLLLFVLSLVMLRSAGRRARERRRDRKKVGELSEKLEEYKQRTSTHDPEGSGRHSGAGAPATTTTGTTATGTTATDTTGETAASPTTESDTARPENGGSSPRA